MTDLKERREKRSISLKLRALALFHHVLSALSEIILSRASEKMFYFTSLPLQHSQVVCLFRLWLLAPAVFWLLCTLCTVHSWYLHSAWKVVVYKKNRPIEAIFSAPSLCKRRRGWKAVQELYLDLPQTPNRVCLFDYLLQIFLRRISPIENAWALIWIYF